MAKKRVQEVSQLRRFAKIYCPLHGHFEVPMLPPVSCPRCEVEWRHGDLLRRPKGEERRRQRKERERLKYLEEDGGSEA